MDTSIDLPACGVAKVLPSRVWFPLAAAIFLSLGLVGFVAGCSRKSPADAKTAMQKTAAAYTRIGEELAQMAAAARPDRVVLVRAVGDPVRDKDFDFAEKAFLKKLSGVPVELLKLEEAPVSGNTAQAAALRSLRTLDADTLAVAAAKAGPKGVVASLVGEPVGTLSPVVSARVVCFAECRDGGAQLAQRIRAGIVIGAVAPRHTNPPAGEEDWYELRYTTVNKDSVGAWMPQ